EAEPGLEMFDQPLPHERRADGAAPLALQRSHRLVARRTAPHQAEWLQVRTDVEIGAEVTHPVADGDADGGELPRTDPDAARRVPRFTADAEVTDQVVEGGAEPEQVLRDVQSEPVQRQDGVNGQLPRGVQDAA